MPFTSRKEDDGLWQIVNSETGEVVGYAYDAESASRKTALHNQRAESKKARGEGGLIRRALDAFKS